MVRLATQDELFEDDLVKVFGLTKRTNVLNAKTFLKKVLLWVIILEIVGIVFLNVLGYYYYVWSYFQS